MTQTIKKLKTLKVNPHQKKVGLALSGGSARGWAHIGVIRALQNAHIPIDMIAGTSIGAFVGAIYAADELDELEVFVRELDWKSVVSYFDMVFPTKGLLDGSKITELLSNRLKQLNIQDASIPFCCVATDITTGKEIHIKEGSMVDAVRASIAIPGIFTPLHKDGKYLSDGGIVNPLPVDVVQQMGADVVIAINLNRNWPITPEMMAKKEKKDANGSSSLEKVKIERKLSEAKTKEIENRKEGLIEYVQSTYATLQEDLQKKLDEWLPKQEEKKPSEPNIFDIIGTSVNVMQERVTRYILDSYPPDVLIEPHLNQYNMFDYDQANAIITEGYEATNKALPEIFKKLQATEKLLK
jgi:NTE family protein